MALELQVRQTVLATLIGRVVQQSLMTACVPTTGDYFVDHANALPGRARWTVSNDGKTLLLLPVEVFVVERAELLAAVGQVPAGATNSRGSVELKVWVRIEGTEIVVAVDDVDLGS